MLAVTRLVRKHKKLTKRTVCAALSFIDADSGAIAAKANNVRLQAIRESAKRLILKHAAVDPEQNLLAQHPYTVPLPLIRRRSGSSYAERLLMGSG